MKHSCIALITCMGLALVACQTQLPVDLSGITGVKLSDEEKIALVLEDVQRGMENKRVYQVLAHVSRNYKDAEGRDYAALRADLNALMRDYRDVRITRTPPRIRVQGHRARVVDAFGTIAESVDPVENPSVNLQGQVIIIMERFGDTWQIVEWGPVS